MRGSFRMQMKKNFVALIDIGETEKFGRNVPAAIWKETRNSTLPRLLAQIFSILAFFSCVLVDRNRSASQGSRCNFSSRSGRTSG